MKKEKGLKMKSLFIKLKIQLAICLISIFSFSYYAYSPAKAASIIADTPCDSLYYETLAARAWLEAQREITQNQNIILKPDSVLEYTCFDRLVRELAVHAEQMFSETINYGAPLGSGSMDAALQNLIGTSLSVYMERNYGHLGVGNPLSYDLLGGHLAGSGIKHNMRPITGGPTYSCNIMGRVWHAAKCINFGSNRNAAGQVTDGFFTFQEYATGAPKRHLPAFCAPINANYVSNIGAGLLTGPWTNDPVQTYLEKTTPPACSGTTCPCTGDPIPTGISVVRPGASPTTYDEHICLQPGCRYHPGGDLFSGSGNVSAGCYGR